MAYIPFTEEEKLLANSVDLPEFLRNHGEKLERAGREYKLIYTDGSGRHDSITISGSTWYDHKNQVGGGAIRFVQQFYGKTFPEAVRMLLGGNVPVQRTVAEPIMTKEEKEFTLPETNKNMHRVYAYLIKQRCISPEILTFFARQHTLYEEKHHHNAVFVGLDKSGVPRQAHMRSTSTYGSGFRITCEGSDTRFSFAHFGESDRLFVFEAPIDLMSYLTLHPENWQDHSYIALNGVHENALIQALSDHPNVKTVHLCLDHDIGGIEAADRLTDRLHEIGYTQIMTEFPQKKDWNEQLKAAHGRNALPAVPHPRKEMFGKMVAELTYYPCKIDQLKSRISATVLSGQHKYLAEYALSGAAFFLAQRDEKSAFLKLQRKLQKDYKPYTDKAGFHAKSDNLRNISKAVMQDLRRTARTKEQTLHTAKLLYDLADCAVRCETETILQTPVQTEEQEEMEEEPCLTQQI